ncbi:hypothetical protein BsWGS_23679 [Bradybaena similaris]
MENRKVQRWALSISGYDCEIQYIKGLDNTVADLLSRIPGECREDDATEQPEISDKALQINVLNSNQFTPRDYAGYKPPEPESLVPPSLIAYDMIAEQGKDGDIDKIKRTLAGNTASKATHASFMVIDGVVYYISSPDDEPHLRLYIPKHLQPQALNQYHEENGHMGTDKTYSAIRSKYYWPGCDASDASTPYQRGYTLRTQPLSQNEGESSDSDPNTERRQARTKTQEETTGPGSSTVRPLDRVIWRAKRCRSDSSSEGYIPLAELQRRLRKRTRENPSYSVQGSINHDSSDTILYSYSEGAMSEEEEISDDVALNIGNIINSDVNDRDANHSYDWKGEERKYKSELPLRDASFDTPGNAAVKSAENVRWNRKDVSKTKEADSDEYLTASDSQDSSAPWRRNASAPSPEMLAKLAVASPVLAHANRYFNTSSSDTEGRVPLRRDKRQIRKSYRGNYRCGRCRHRSRPVKGSACA